MATPAKRRIVAKAPRRSPSDVSGKLPVVRPSAAVSSARSSAGSSAGSSVDELLGGKVLAGPKTSRKTNKKEKAVEKLPGELAQLGDVFVAGRKISREIDFKVAFAEQRVKEYCLKRFCEKFAEQGERPSSATFAGENSLFTFIQTRRVSLTPEKADALKHLGISLEGNTQLRGLHINFQAIRDHGLEIKLRDALAGMGVDKDVLLECFQPDVQLKDNFFDRLGNLVETSLRKGEALADKLFDVMKILHPAEQIRSAESPNLDAIKSFRLIHDAEISVTDDLDALDD